MADQHLMRWILSTSHCMAPSDVADQHLVRWILSTFEVGTPDHLRAGRLSAAFVEYLMGYPRGYTAAS